MALSSCGVAGAAPSLPVSTARTRDCAGAPPPGAPGLAAGAAGWTPAFTRSAVVRQRGSSTLPHCARQHTSLVTGGTPGLCSDRCQQRRCLPRPVPLLKGHASLIRARHESSAATPSPKNPAAGEPGTGRGRTSYSWCAARRRLDTAMPWPCRRSSSSPFAAAPATSSCVTCADSRESVEMRSATWTCGSLADAGVTCDPAGAACGPARAAHCLSTRTRSAAALRDARLPACTQARAQTQTRAHANPAPPRPRARTAQVT